MFIIGITGGLATGKSTVSEMFAQLGAKVLDADKIAHGLIGRNGKCVEKIKKTFGQDVISKGAVNRKALADIVFNNTAKLKKLEAIIHPQVRLNVKERLKELKKKKFKGIVVVDVPLLFEAKMDRDMDMTIVVKTRRDIQIQRAKKSLNLTQQQALSRIKAQMPLNKKAKLADMVIDNSRSKKETSKKVKKIWLRA
ncbi:MAG: dephospho-CoA kinase [Candidatus Omnitrophica bacterium]|nr:dephospho-CoA kinase [Candidatus Omnitrophota bacterium]